MSAPRSGAVMVRWDFGMSRRFEAKRYGRRFGTELSVLVNTGRSVGELTEKLLEFGASWGGLGRVGSLAK